MIKLYGLNVSPFVRKVMADWLEEYGGTALAESASGIFFHRCLAAFKSMQPRSGLGSIRGQIPRPICHGQVSGLLAQLLHVGQTR